MRRFNPTQSDTAPFAYIKIKDETPFPGNDPSAELNYRKLCTNNTRANKIIIDLLLDHDPFQIKRHVSLDKIGDEIRSNGYS